MVCVTMTMCSSTMHPQIVCPKLLRAMKKPKSSSELTKLFVEKHFPISKLNWQMEPRSGAGQEPCHIQPLPAGASAMANWECKLTSEVGESADPGDWNLPLPGPLTELQWRERGKTKQEIHKLTGHVVRHLQSKSQST